MVEELEQVKINPTPQVSIVIPSYNHAAYIGEAISSVLNQTFGNFELIIVDDHSKDHSDQVIKSFTDSRIRYEWHQENVGAVPTLNYALSIAKAPYICLLNSDDVWLPNKLALQLLHLEQHPDVDILFTDAYFIDHHGKVLQESDYPHLHQFSQQNRTSGEWLRKFFNDFNCLCHPSMMIRRTLYTERLYHPALRQLPDYHMWVHLVKKHKIYVLEDKLVKFRIHEQECHTSASTADNHIRFCNELYFILLSFFDDVRASTLIEGFRDLITSEEALENQDVLRCEQAFLYFQVQNEFAHIYRLIGQQKLYELLSEEVTRAILRDRFHFTDQSFFENTGRYRGLYYGERPFVRGIKLRLRQFVDRSKWLRIGLNRLIYLIKRG